MAMPVIANHLYLPRRETNCPARILPNTDVSVSGVMMRPLLEMEVPITPWINSGMKKMLPKRPMLKTTVTMVETVKMLFLNRLGSIIGCPFRRSSHAS